MQETCRKLQAEGTYFTSFAVVESEELRDSIVNKTKMGQQVREQWERCGEALFGVGPVGRESLFSEEVLTKEQGRRL